MSMEPFALEGDQLLEIACAAAPATAIGDDEEVGVRSLGLNDLADIAEDIGEFAARGLEAFAFDDDFRAILSRDGEVALCLQPLEAGVGDAGVEGRRAAVEGAQQQRGDFLFEQTAATNSGDGAAAALAVTVFQHVGECPGAVQQGSEPGAEVERHEDLRQPRRMLPAQGLQLLPIDTGVGPVRSGFRWPGWRRRPD